MAKKRLSQVQKVILLVADEEMREWKSESVVYQRMLKRIAKRCGMHTKRRELMRDEYLATFSRSVRNLANKGLLELTFKRNYEFPRLNSRFIRSLILTVKVNWGRFMKVLTGQGIIKSFLRGEYADIFFARRRKRRGKNYPKVPPS